MPLDPSSSIDALPRATMVRSAFGGTSQVYTDLLWEEVR